MAVFLQMLGYSPTDPTKLEYTPLPSEFLGSFVAFATKNGTLRTERDFEYPDVMSITGTDQLGRDLVGSWSLNAAPLRGDYIVLFREITQHHAVAAALT